MIRSRAGLIVLLPFLAVSAGPEEDYAARAAKLEGKKDAKGWLALADFAEEKALLDRREEALRKALELDPGNAAAHERLDEVLVGKDWLPADEADRKEIGENEAKGLVFYGTKWMAAKEADRLREADRKSVGWAVSVRLDMPHLTLYSGMDLPYTRRLSRTLENGVDAYLHAYGKVWRLDPKFKPVRAFQFATFEDYAGFTLKAFGQAKSEGDPAFYHVNGRTLYVMGVHDRNKHDSERHRTGYAVHEMLHALDDVLARLGPSLPAWCKEGRAHHFGYAVRDLRVLPGLASIPPHDALLIELERGLDAFPLSRLLALDADGFATRDRNQNYAQAWAFVHFLLHAEQGRHAEGFRKYLSGLPAKGNLAAFEAAVGKVSDLQEPYVRYAREVLIPLGKASQER